MAISDYKDFDGTTERQNFPINGSSTSTNVSLATSLVENQPVVSEKYGVDNRDQSFFETLKRSLTT